MSEVEPMKIKNCKLKISKEKSHTVYAAWLLNKELISLRARFMLGDDLLLNGDHPPRHLLADDLSQSLGRLVRIRLYLSYRKKPFLSRFLLHHSNSFLTRHA